ncbi:MAG: hypothetical protein J2P50_03260, partial [Hyphomicrobiaceae bacterium]|nr:hypothetical protein [Hyphomicrobiaceae bacterium]
FAPLWGVWQREHIERLKRGLATKNASVAFAEYIRSGLDRESLSARIGEILRTQIAHPTDSHPPVAERLAAIGGRIPLYDAVALLTEVTGSTAALGHLDDIETELTVLQQDLLIRLIRAGRVAKPIHIGGGLEA